MIVMSLISKSVFKPENRKGIMLKLRTPSRIHITLIDLNGSIGRVDGEVGLALEEPHIEIRAEESDTFILKGNPINKERFEIAAAKMVEYSGMGAEIEVVSDYEAHVGLGSGTQIEPCCWQGFQRALQFKSQNKADCGNHGQRRDFRHWSCSV